MSVTPSSNQLECNHQPGKVQMGYFINWGIYGLNFQPTDINPSLLTHILYAFADINRDGTIKLTDEWADIEKPYTPQEPGNNLYGCLGYIFGLKLKHRHLKVLLSIGGWNASQQGHFNNITDPTIRDNFVKSAVQFVKDYGLDGIDIDYEYPDTPERGEGLALLLVSLREAFDELAISNDDKVPYQITAAVGAGESGYRFLDIPAMDKVLDYWNVMAYDYSGSWSDRVYHFDNLFEDGECNSGVNTDKAMNLYISKGASKYKLVMGIPLYGRVFKNTDGKCKPFSGVEDSLNGPLPPLDVQTQYDEKAVANYSYDETKREFVSFNASEAITAKADYVSSKGMSGLMFWNLANNKGISEGLIETSAKHFESLNPSNPLDRTCNHTCYPNSKWDNVR